MLRLYGQARTYRATGTVVEFESEGQHRVENAQTFDLVFSRNLGIKLVVHAVHRDGSHVETVAWGPLDNVKLFVEHRRDDFIEMTETPDPKVRYASRFNQLVSQTFTNPGDVIGGLLIDAKLPLLSNRSGTTEGSGQGVDTILQGRREETFWREFSLDPANATLQTVVAHIASSGRWTTQIRITHQKFEGAVKADELAYTQPAYGAAFDPRSALDANQRKAVFDDLARAGSNDGRVRTLLTGIVKPGQAPDAATFSVLIERLQQAEKLGYVDGYAEEAQMMQPSNRNWFPAELASLSDAQINARQRAILWNGANQCSARATWALRKTVHPPLTSQETSELDTTDERCAMKAMPKEIREAQAKVDRNGVDNAL